MDPFTTFNSGQPLKVSAELHRILVRVAQWWIGQQRSDQKATKSGIPVEGKLRIVNISGAVRDQFNIVALGNKIIGPSGADSSAFGDKVFESATPDATMPFAILQEPAGQNSLAPALMSGLSWVKIDLTDATHTHALPIDDDYEKLASSADPTSCEILWADSPAAAHIAGGISDTDPTLTVDSSEGFPAPPFVVTIESEQLNVTAIVGEDWTVTRGFNGTTAASHADASAVMFASDIVWALVRLIGGVAGTEPTIQIMLPAPVETTSEGTYYDVIDLGRDNATETFTDGEPCWFLDLRGSTSQVVGTRYIAHELGREAHGQVFINTSAGLVPVSGDINSLTTWAFNSHPEDEVVDYSGQFWKANTDTIGEPGVSADWDAVAAWAAGSYSANQTVTNSGAVWTCLTATAEEPNIGAIDWMQEVDDPWVLVGEMSYPGNVKLYGSSTWTFTGLIPSTGEPGVSADWTETPTITDVGAIDSGATLGVGDYGQVTRRTLDGRTGSGAQLGPQLRITTGTLINGTFACKRLTIDPATNGSSVGDDIWGIDLSNAGALTAGKDYLCHELGSGPGGVFYVSLVVANLANALTDTASWLATTSDPTSTRAYLAAIVVELDIANGPQTVADEPFDFASTLTMEITDADSSTTAGIVQIVGTNALGDALHETIDIANAGTHTYTTTGVFKTVASITVADLAGQAAGDTIKVTITQYPLGIIRSNSGSTYIVNTPTDQAPGTTDWTEITGTLTSAGGYSDSDSYDSGAYVQRVLDKCDFNSIFIPDFSEPWPGDPIFSIGTAGTDINFVESATPPAWDPAQAYSVGWSVTRLGITYRCILAHTNQAPPNAAYWQEIDGSLSILNVPDWGPSARGVFTNENQTGTGTKTLTGATGQWVAAEGTNSANLTSGAVLVFGGGVASSLTSSDLRFTDPTTGIGGILFIGNETTIYASAPLMSGAIFVVDAGGSASLSPGPYVISGTPGVSGTIKFGATAKGGLVTALGNDITEADITDALSTWGGSTAIATVGTITLGVWQGTPIAIEMGGTNATDASSARVNMGLAIGADVQAWSANLDTLAGNDGSALTGVLKPADIGVSVQAYSANLDTLATLDGSTLTGITPAQVGALAPSDIGSTVEAWSAALDQLAGLDGSSLTGITPAQVGALAPADIGSTVQAWSANLDVVTGTNTGDQDLSGYYTKSEIDSAISNYYTKAEVDAAIAACLAAALAAD